MNKKDRQRHINRVLNTIRRSNRLSLHTNCFRYFKNNSDVHELAKFYLYKELIDEGHVVMTEVIFENGSRCDILDVTDGIIYEILFSESREEAEGKATKYPFTTEYYQAEKILERYKP